MFNNYKINKTPNVNKTYIIITTMFLLMNITPLTHIGHINSFDTGIDHYSKKSLNKKQYYNFFNENFPFRKIENILLTQQADITNNITETNNQTFTYVDNSYLNIDKIATIILNPTPSLTESYLWIPEGISDYVVPGLDNLLTHTQPKYATLTSLQNSIANIK